MTIAIGFVRIRVVVSGRPNSESYKRGVIYSLIEYRLVNKLREPGGLPAVKYQGNAHVPLVAMDNIDAFNKAAVEYGLPASFAFPSNDLYEAHKGTFYKVIRCLDQLGVEVRALHTLASNYAIVGYNRS